MNAPPENSPGELHVIAETAEIAALCLEGEFDLANAPQIVEAGERLLADDKQVILDLSEATFIDLSVIEALLHVRAEARKNGHVVVLQLGTAAVVERVVQISGLERALPRTSTRREAIDKILQSRPPAAS